MLKVLILTLLTVFAEMFTKSMNERLIKVGEYKGAYK